MFLIVNYQNFRSEIINYFSKSNFDNYLNIAWLTYLLVLGIFDRNKENRS